MLGEVSLRLCDKFDESCPILDKGSTRYKVARLSAALAVRTFSCTEGREDILIRKCHVEAIYDILDKVYSNTTIGYLNYSEQVKFLTTLDIVSVFSNLHKSNPLGT